jgi:hypothetical protein
VKHALKCTYCGTPIHAAPGARSATCSHCGAPAPVPTGSVLLTARFDQLHPPGWEACTGPKHGLSLDPGPPPELCVAFGPDSGRSIWVVLRSTGSYDDVDVSVTVRHLVGGASAGMELRASKTGSYAATLVADGRLLVTHYEGQKTELKAHALLPGSRPRPEARVGMGVSNELRFVARDDKLRVYLNGKLASSLHEPSLRAGLVKLVVNPRGGPACVAFSDVVVREPE